MIRRKKAFDSRVGRIFHDIVRCARRDDVAEGGDGAGRALLPGFPVKFLAKCISDHDGEDGPELTTAAEACGDVVFREIHLNLMAVAIGDLHAFPIACIEGQEIRLAHYKVGSIEGSHILMGVGSLRVIDFLTPRRVLELGGNPDGHEIWKVVKNLAEFVDGSGDDLVEAGGVGRRLVDNPGGRRREKGGGIGKQQQGIAGMAPRGGRLPAVERCGIDSLGSFEGGDFLGQFHVALAVGGGEDLLDLIDSDELSGVRRGREQRGKQQDGGHAHQDAQQYRPAARDARDGRVAAC